MLKLSQKSAALKENYHQIQLKKKNFQKITLKKQEQEIFAAQRSKPFVERFTTISKNFDETIGELAGNCLQKDPEIFQRIHEKYKKVDEKAGTSSWKEIKEKGKCDAASVHNLQFKEKHIKDAHRSDQLNKYISQVYLKRAWKDFDFIGKLMKNDVLDDSRQNEECKGKIQVHQTI